MNNTHRILPAIVALAACGATPAPLSTGPAKELHDFVFVQAFSAVVAEPIAEECSGLRYSKSHENLMTDLTATRSSDQGYTKHDLDVALSGVDKKRAQSDFFDYIETSAQLRLS